MIGAEVLAVGGYALVLAVIGLGLDALARTTHLRGEAYRTAGFEYSADHDHWLCPEGQHLWPHEHDYERRVVRYRAKAHVCNACHAKHLCTDSDDGREITRSLDPWPHSEAGRFHRGIALVPVALAAVILVGEAVRHPAPAALGVLAAAGAVVALAGRRLVADFRRAPANFPGAAELRGVSDGASAPSRYRD